MFLLIDANKNEDIDYRALRKDLVDDAGIDSIVTGEFPPRNNFDTRFLMHQNAPKLKK